jgi:beta-1,4-mannosyl-glycoprotein beta-1,4-N-acetylglucosaminyltransferase
LDAVGICEEGMIVDTFMVNNEMDMMEFRLRYLYDYVDRFVVVEADHTHSGNPKGFNVMENLERFEWARDKLSFYLVNIKTEGLDFSIKPKEFDFDAPQWRVENQQRNAIADACKDFADDDIIMMSDCDEIPSRHVVKFRRENKIEHPFACDQRIVAFYLDYTRLDIGWRGTIMSTLKQMREYTPQGLRNLRIKLSPMPHGGWHFTFFGGAEQIRKKIQSYAHQEMNKDEYLDLNKIEELTKRGKGIFPDSGQPLKKVGKEFYPQDLLELVPEGWWV